MKKCLTILALVGLTLVLAGLGCGKKAVTTDAGAPGAAPTPGTPSAAAPGGAPGAVPAPDAKSGGDPKAAFENARQQYPGTFAVVRAVAGLRGIENDPKGATFSKAQAQGLAPILKDLLARPTLTQDDANKIASSINGFLTPDQQSKLDEARRARMSQKGGGRPGGNGGPGGGAPGMGRGGNGGGAKGGPGARNGGGGGGGRMDWIRTMTPDKNPFLEGKLKESTAELLTTLEAKAK